MKSGYVSFHTEKKIYLQIGGSYQKYDYLCSIINFKSFIMKKLVIALLACCTVVMFGCKKEEVKDKNTIKGIITFSDADLEETHPAKGAVVRVHNDKAEAYVAETKAATDGSYSFTNLKDGKYQISATHTETELFDQPEVYKARTANYEVKGEQVQEVNITCKK